MNKVLTISIAAYNVENYIEEALDSLVSSKYIEELEIFVIDDGGKDNTLLIAKKYAEKFPNSVFPIHKENGGYGSTVNYSMRNATGKYFKLLDGDDWFNTDELDKLIEKMKITSSDVIITPYLYGSDRDNMQISEYSNSFKIGKEIKISEINNLCKIGMWALAYKTEVLRISNMTLPEKLFYTDQIFCTIPFAFANTIQYFDYPIYSYRLGREGQSVSRESRIKNIKMTLDICEMLSEFVAKYKTHNNYKYMLYRVTAYYFAALKTIMLLGPNCGTLSHLKEYENRIRNISNDVYNDVIRFGKLGLFIKLCRLSNYYAIYILKIIYPNGLPNWA